MDAMCAENVLNGTEGIYRNRLFRENVLGGTKSWFTTSNLSGLPLPHNPQLVSPLPGVVRLAEVRGTTSTPGLTRFYP